jgi:hypothetical protein
MNHGTRLFTAARHRSTLSAEVRRHLGVLAVILAAIFSPGHTWTNPSHWSPDGLFYEAQRLEVGGAAAQNARNRVFFTDPGYVHARDDAFPIGSPTRAALLNHPWVEYSAAFYRRRWAVPLAAEAISPLFGQRSLLLVSLAGYVAFAVLLYGWLRIRFPSLVSAAVTIAALRLLPLREWSFLPLTDSWGLAVLLVSTYASYCVLTASRRWLAIFFPAMAVLAFTRDNGIVLIVAALVLALLYRRREGWLLAGAGIAATLPAWLAFGVPARTQLSYILNEYQPATGGWAFVARHYPRGLADLLSHDRTYVLNHVGVGLFFVAGLLVLLWRARTKDAYTQLVCAAAVGGVAVLLMTPNPTGTGFRLELVLLPPVTCGIAYGLMAASAHLRALPRRAGSERG